MIFRDGFVLVRCPTLNLSVIWGRLLFFAKTCDFLFRWRIHQCFGFQVAHVADSVAVMGKEKAFWRNRNSRGCSVFVKVFSVSQFVALIGS